MYVVKNQRRQNHPSSSMSLEMHFYSNYFNTVYVLLISQFFNCASLLNFKEIFGRYLVLHVLFLPRLGQALVNMIMNSGFCKRQRAS
jgi:hypothetical protein